MEIGNLSIKKLHLKVFMTTNKKPQPDKIIVILGPTSSGKSDAAILLAQKFDGEIVSSDSRQIYRGMDLGTGKVTKEEQKMAKHWLIDIVSPKTAFSAAQYRKRATRAIDDVLGRGKLPILCGGTGFWIKSVVDNVDFPEVKPDRKLRKDLSEKTAEELFEILQKLDPGRAQNIDAKNKVRLIRAIEIAKALGKVPEVKSDPKYDALQIGIKMTKEVLHERIEKRLEKRFAAGMIDEVARLHGEGVSWKRLESFGLEYRWIAMFLQGKISEQEMKNNLLQESKNYAKRQMTWFAKDKRIIWLEKYKDMEKEVKKFL